MKYALVICIAFLGISCVGAMPGKTRNEEQVPGKASESSSSTSPAEASGTVVTVRGVLEAYGNEPHIIWLIRTDDGRRYLPKGELQKSVSRLPPLVYDWTGILEPPGKSLSVLVPEHDGIFTTLLWQPVR